MSQFNIHYAGTSPTFLKKVEATAAIVRHAPTVMDPLRLQSAYRGLKSLEILEESGRGRVKLFYDRVSDTVSLYPAFFSTRPDYDVYEAFGQRHWEKNLSQQEQLQWINAMVFPSPRTLEKFVEAVKRGVTDYMQIVNSFTDPDERLVAVHLANALIKNNTTPSQAKYLDLQHYPPTADFISARTAYSARPLLQTYRPGHDSKNSYAKAFAEYCVNKGKFISTIPAISQLYKALFSAVTFD